MLIFHCQKMTIDMHEVDLSSQNNLIFGILYDVDFGLLTPI